METTKTGTRTKKETIELVENSFPSIWSKEDVLKLLNQLEEQEEEDMLIDEDEIDETKKFVLDLVRKKITKLKNSIISSVEDLRTDDICDFDSAELELNGKELSVTGIDINYTCIEDAIESDIDKFIDDLENELTKI